MNIIAIFQYKRPLQIHTKNIIIALSNAGFAVDLFFHGSPDAYLTFGELLSIKNFRIHNISISCLSRKLFTLYQEFQSFFFAKREIIHPSAIKFVKKRLKCFCLFIGIEKMGLIWAGEISNRFLKTPIINYSLEIYDDNHPFFIGMRSFPFIRKAELFYARRMNGLIIQDTFRAAEYKKYNGIENKESCGTFFLPVSIQGSKIERKGTYWHNKYQLESYRKIVLIFGIIRESRQSISIASECSKLGPKFITVFHGPLELPISDISQYCKDNVYINNELVPENRISELISSSDVGIVLYSNANNNDRLTAFSSEKIARFMQCGIPIISYDNMNYRKLMKEFRCGELIETLSEIPLSLTRIFSDYKSYQLNCYKAFDKYYQFQTHEQSLIEFMENVVHDTENKNTYTSG